MSAKNGGPAFPIDYQLAGVRTIDEGMSLRDWFAGQAMAGICANDTGLIRLNQMNQERDGEPPKPLAKACYDIADAMLAEREKVS